MVKETADHPCLARLWTGKEGFPAMEYVLHVVGRSRDRDFDSQHQVAATLFSLLNACDTVDWVIPRCAAIASMVCPSA